MKRLILTALFLLGTLSVLSAQNKEAEDLDSKYAADLLPSGTPAPDFSLGDINGKTVSLSDFRGRKVVLHFWASWCPDCRAEVPGLKAVQAAADPSKVAFVSVSFDRSFSEFETYVKENYLGGVQLFEPSGKKDSAVGKAYGVKWIPSTYIIDTDGKILLGTVMMSKVADALGAGSGSKAFGRDLCQDESCAN